MWNYVAHVVSWLPFLLLLGSTLLLVVFVVGLNRGYFRQSLSWCSWRHILSLATMSFHEERLLASLEAEELVETALRAAGWRHVFLRRRVHVQRLGYNREMDVVAVGPVVLVVEVKHWRGHVWSNGPRWFQCARNDKNTLEFEDIQEDNLVKAAALRRFIENDKRIPLPDYHVLSNDTPTFSENGMLGTSREYGTWYTDRRLHKQCGKLIVPVVVFTNPNVILDPNTVKMKERVFDLPSFRVYAEKLMRDLRGPSTRISSWEAPVQLLRHFFFAPPRDILTLSVQEEERLSAVIDTMRTWDMIYLHNGRVLHGDVVEIHLPSVQRHLERKHVLDFKVQWFNGIVGFLQSLWVGGGGMVFVRLSMGRDEISFPIIQKRRRRIGFDDRLIIKLAGSRNTETVAVADTFKVQFSHHLEELHN